MSFYETLNWHERLFWSRSREKRELMEINLHLSKALIDNLTEENIQLKEDIQKLKEKL